MVIVTYTGARFSPMAATEQDIHIEDIAHALSLLCRANGHLTQFLSVAQHSLNCMEEARARQYSPRLRLACLLHDGSEAYLSDVTRPVKAELPEYQEAERRLQGLIYQKYLGGPLSDEESERLAQVDDAMLYHEFLELKGERVFDTAPPIVSKPTLLLRDFSVVERQFLDAFGKLNEVLQQRRLKVHNL